MIKTEIESYNDAMCILPWDSVAIRPFAKAMPCCRFRRPHDFLNESNILMDFRNSKSWNDVREKMLRGEKLDECGQCYRDEASGSKSTRQLDTTEYLKKGNLLPITTEPKKIRFLEIAFSNLCNLACVSCNEWFSSTWGTEKYKHGRSNPQVLKVKVEHNSNLEDFDLSGVTQLKIIGGEPMMDQKRFINLMKRLTLEKVRLLVSTNGTVMPGQELKELLEQCEEVIYEVSLDGVGSVNEWYRWPTKMSEVETNMDQLQEWWGNNPIFQLKVHSVINIYNVWSMDRFVNYMSNRRPNWRIDFDWIRNPFWQAICILPEEFKEDLKDRLIYWDKTVPGKWPNYKKSPFLVTIDRLYDAPNSLNELKEFKKQTLLLAKERKLDIFGIVPEIKDLFDNE